LPAKFSLLKKNILVIYYTQSGQLREILDVTLGPLLSSDTIRVDYKIIEPEPHYPFPWGRYTFYDAFPESVFEIPCAIKPLQTAPSDSYDLVVLAYQPWFLSPSIPMNSFLQSEDAKKILAGKEVLTVIGCRNMWLQAQEVVKRKIAAAGGMLVGNIVLFDRSPHLTSVVTILYWMLSGKRNRMLGIFPTPGVQKKDVEKSSVFGEVILKALKEGSRTGLQERLVAAGAVEVKPHLMSLENRAKKIFRLWADFVLKKGGAGNLARKWRLKAFSYYLPTAIFIASPIVFTLTTLVNLVNPAKVKKEKAYYSGVSLPKPD
jgi:hypothetical protein